MKKIKFYFCPTCGNILTAINESMITCCGKKLEVLPLKKADEQNALCVEKIENDYYITSSHEMTKQHYITFVALLTGDSVIFRKQYPEWNLQTRIPCFAHGMLVWHCNKDGLFYKNI